MWDVLRVDLAPEPAGLFDAVPDDDLAARLDDPTAVEVALFGEDAVVGAFAVGVDLPSRSFPPVRGGEIQVGGEQARDLVEDAGVVGAFEFRGPGSMPNSPLPKKALTRSQCVRRRG